MRLITANPNGSCPSASLTLQGRQLRHHVIETRAIDGYRVLACHGPCFANHNSHCQGPYWSSEARLLLSAQTEPGESQKSARSLCTSGKKMLLPEKRFRGSPLANQDDDTILRVHSSPFSSLHTRLSGNLPYENRKASRCPSRAREPTSVSPCSYLSGAESWSHRSGNATAIAMDSHGLMDLLISQGLKDVNTEWSEKTSMIMH